MTSPSPRTHLTPVITAGDVEEARAIVREYVDSLGEAAEYIGLDEELAVLPTMYGPPGGLFLLARDGATVAGCAAMRRFDDEAAELRRLYVRPTYRGKGLGRRLVETLIDEARRLGYRRMLLDTLETLTTAQALYASLGFQPVPPYYQSPIPGTLYFARDL